MVAHGPANPVFKWPMEKPLNVLATQTTIVIHENSSFYIKQIYFTLRSHKLNHMAASSFSNLGPNSLVIYPTFSINRYCFCQRTLSSHFSTSGANFRCLYTILVALTSLSFNLCSSLSFSSISTSNFWRPDLVCSKGNFI